MPERDPHAPRAMESAPDLGRSLPLLAGRPLVAWVVELAATALWEPSSYECDDERRRAGAPAWDDWQQGEAVDGNVTERQRCGTVCRTSDTDASVIVGADLLGRLHESDAALVEVQGAAIGDAVLRMNRPDAASDDVGGD